MTRTAKRPAALAARAVLGAVLTLGALSLAWLSTVALAGPTGDPPCAFTPAGCAPPRCDGKLATLRGTPNDDSIVGTKRRDVIQVGQGEDMVRGRGGKDLICGGTGPDLLLGNGEDDELHGGLGSDRVLFGGAGDDLLAGARGPDDLAGGPDDDRLVGGRGADGLNGDDGSDFCDGGPPTPDEGGRGSADVADRIGCEEIRRAKAGRIEFGSRPAFPD